MTSPHFHIPYAVPTVLLAVALAFKFPTFVRAWRDPDVRATTLLLTWATAVLVVITPVNIDRLNRLTGVANIAAPWAYSFLTAFCATGLTMIMRWREEPSPRRRRSMRRIYALYAGVVVALWVTFLLADAPTPRIYDFDTYYASTPWIREHILLYLVAHMVSSLVAAYMLWTWFPQIANLWLKSGVVLLQLGFLSGLAFDITKLIAVGARWAGRDLDGLSTYAAPPFALLEAILVALGFIVPQAGPFLTRWARDQRDYRRLGHLWRVVRILEPGAAPARFGYLAPLDLRLIQRQQHIHDALRLLAPYYTPALYHRAHETAVAAGHGAEQARALAGALAVQHAVDASRNNAPRSTGAQTGTETGAQTSAETGAQIGAEISDHIDAISAVLKRPHVIDDIRQRVMNTESLDSHA